MKKSILFFLLSIQLFQVASAQKTSAPRPVVKTLNGQVEGTLEQSSVQSFKGIPFAAPPVGDLRWREPQPVKNWKGKLDAKKFGSNGMQTNVFGDMAFRSKGMS